MKPRNIVVTGASSGIGYACASKLLDAGHCVTGISRRPTNIDHASFNSMNIDLSSPGAFSALDSLAKSNPEIDVVISNAGGGHFGSLENFSAVQIRESLNQNLVSHVLMVRAFVTSLKRHSRSDIVFIGSEAALTGARNGSLYCAAKFGVRGFAQSLREECARQNVHVGIINPGMVRSEFFDTLDFEPGAAEENALTADDVVSAVLTMLSANDNAVVDEINLSPLTRVVNKRPLKT